MINTPPAPVDEPDRPTLIATRGLPASGKTTWALAQLTADTTGRLARCNRDDLRRMTQGQPRYDTDSESVITTLQQDILIILLNTGHSVVVDDTNLSQTTLDNLQFIARMHGASFRVQDFTHVPVEFCIMRDRRRGEQAVGADVIRDMHERYLTGGDPT